METVAFPLPHANIREEKLGHVYWHVGSGVRNGLAMSSTVDQLKGKEEELTKGWDIASGNNKEKGEVFPPAQLHGKK